MYLGLARSPSAGADKAERAEERGARSLGHAAWHSSLRLAPRGGTLEGCGGHAGSLGSSEGTGPRCPPCLGLVLSRPIALSGGRGWGRGGMRTSRQLWP